MILDIARLRAAGRALPVGFEDAHELAYDGAIVDDLPLDGDGGESARKAMEKAGLL